MYQGDLDRHQPRRTVSMLGEGAVGKTRLLPQHENNWAKNGSSCKRSGDHSCRSSDCLKIGRKKPRERIVQCVWVQNYVTHRAGFPLGKGSRTEFLYPAQSQDEQRKHMSASAFSADRTAPVEKGEQGGGKAAPATSP